MTPGDIVKIKTLDVPYTLMLERYSSPTRSCKIKRSHLIVERRDVMLIVAMRENLEEGSWWCVFHPSVGLNWINPDAITSFVALSAGT